jgi:Leucine-rich repeat (LRR) protein
VIKMGGVKLFGKFYEIKNKKVPVYSSEGSFIRDLASAAGVKGKIPTLELNKKEIHSINEIEGLENCGKIQQLIIKKNAIRSLEGIEVLKNLEILILEGNAITEIDYLDDLANLVVLDVSYNNLNKISGLKTLKNLYLLDVNHNNITELDDIDCCPRLAQLRVNNNPVSEWANSHFDYMKLESSLKDINMVRDYCRDKREMAAYSPIPDQDLQITPMQNTIPITPEPNMIPNATSKASEIAQKLKHESKNINKKIEPKKGISAEKMETLKGLLEMSDKVHISDICAILAVERTEALMTLIKIRKTMPELKISGDDVIVEKGNLDNFISALDGQFSDWTDKEESKDGKIE